MANKPQDNISKDLFTPATETFDQEKVSGPSISFWQDAFRKLRKNKGAIVGIFLVIIITAMSFIGPEISGHKFSDQEIMHTNLPARIPVLENISWLPFDGTTNIGTNPYEDRNLDDVYYWFGSDNLGRDIWTRVWVGTQISLLIGVVAALLDLLIGTLYGAISGFFGGRVDNIMQRIIEVLVGIPNLIVIIMLLIYLKPGIPAIILAMVITGWVNMGRIVRSQILKLKNQEYILASRTLGASNSRLIFKHLFPNSLGQIIITTMFTIPTAIFFEAFLSFIGLGVPVPRASLGSLVDSGFDSLQTFPHMVLFPAIVISVLLISFNMVADGLRDAIDPKMRD
ncbi:oligopeptide ABC transporter permease [Aureibacillus halotolerans]|uniref:Oligopeptide transport system permease protein n=1 Tax=Aureibacillus halotolerans TaxID=1508390 RepID=A0A4R6UAE1_9BACI|nr:oligopeptide ABC transporter permease [Aureibacillus halotolerans]TDQ42816.1 oligopeptide transport system permease protein [Aureibacillus halotolerans]